MSAGGEGRAGTGEHGFSLTGGQVVAGSNPVSPTKFRQVKCYFYLLPRSPTRVNLIRCQRRRGIAASLPGAKPALTCVFCPKARRPDGREEFTTSCDTHVGRRRPRIPFTPRNKPLNRAFPPRGGTIGDDCCGPGCHRLLTSGRRTQRPGRFPPAASVCCVEQVQ